MTPEEHVEKAENLLRIMEDPEDEADTEQQTVRLNKANTHMRIAEFKKKYPPNRGKTSGGRMPVAF